MEQQTQASTQVSHRGYWGYEEIDPASLKKVVGGDGGGSDAGDGGGSDAGDAGGGTGGGCGYGCSGCTSTCGYAVADAMGYNPFGGLGENPGTYGGWSGPAGSTTATVGIRG